MFPAPPPDPVPQQHSEYGHCFFLSYTHTPRIFDEDRDDHDPDYWVGQFFRDLCKELVARDPAWHRSSPSGRPGFMDGSIPDGANWRRRLAVELATCRVFVPLYSRGYFASKECGREWAIFRERQMAHVAQTGKPNEAILPVLWQPPPKQDMPEIALSVQMAQLGVSSRYTERGLFELIRLDRDNEYLRVVIRFAEYLDQIARNGAPPPGPLVDYAGVRPAFPQKADPAGTTRRLHITVAAPAVSGLPPDRDPNFYGAQPEDWQPYRPHLDVPLVRRAEDVARDLGFEPVVSALTGRSPELSPPPPVLPDGPCVVLVDPWIAHEAVDSEAIAEIDRRQKPWVRILVPWSAADAQTAVHAPRLRARLEYLIPWSLAEWRLHARVATRDLATAADFGHAMPRVVEFAWRRYLKAVRPGTPGPFPLRPRLQGPDPALPAGPGSGRGTGTGPASPDPEGAEDDEP